MEEIPNWLGKIFELAANIKTPMGLAGFFAAAFVVIILKVLSTNITSEKQGEEPIKTKAISDKIVERILLFIFSLSLIAMLLAFTGFIYSRFSEPERARASTAKKIPVNLFICKANEDPWSPTVSVFLREIDKTKIASEQGLVSFEIDSPGPKQLHVLVWDRDKRFDDSTFTFSCDSIPDKLVLRPKIVSTTTALTTSLIARTIRVRVVDGTEPISGIRITNGENDFADTTNSDGRLNLKLRLPRNADAIHIYLRDSRPTPRYVAQELVYNVFNNPPIQLTPR